MKTYITLTICIFCFWAGVASHSAPGTNVNSSQSANTNLSLLPETNNTGEGNIDPTPSPTPRLKSEYHAKAGDIKITTYSDNQLESIKFYRKDKLVRLLNYNTDTRELTTEIEYYYKENGEDDHQRVIKGIYYDDSEEGALESKRYEEDFIYQRDYLKSKGIKFPLPDLVGNDISDIAETLAAGDDYPDFKREVRINRDRKTIRFIGFNKTGRYHNSLIALVIHISKASVSDFLNIKDYELVLKNKNPLKEIYKLDIGTATKTFSYKNGNLTDIIYEFAGLKNESGKETVHFEYRVQK